jgi:hypothetical protein
MPIDFRSFPAEPALSEASPRAGKERSEDDARPSDAEWCPSTSTLPSLPRLHLGELLLRSGSGRQPRARERARASWLSTRLGRERAHPRARLAATKVRRERAVPTAKPGSRGPGTGKRGLTLEQRGVLQVPRRCAGIAGQPSGSAVRSRHVARSRTHQGLGALAPAHPVWRHGSRLRISSSVRGRSASGSHVCCSTASAVIATRYCPPACHQQPLRSALPSRAVRPCSRAARRASSAPGRAAASSLNSAMRL